MIALMAAGSAEKITPMQEISSGTTRLMTRMTMATKVTKAARVHTGLRVLPTRALLDFGK